MVSHTPAIDLLTTNGILFTIPDEIGDLRRPDKRNPFARPPGAVSTDKPTLVWPQPVHLRVLPGRSRLTSQP